jgi:hypothetical protein
MEILIFGGVIFAIFVVIKIVGTFNENGDLKNRLNDYMNRYSESSKNLEQKEKDYNILKKREIEQTDWITKQETIRKNILDQIDANLSDRANAYKWLVPLVADAKLILKETSRDSSELVTSRRSYETMARVDSLIREKRALLEENTVLKYQLEYIKTLIPEVDDIVEYDEYLNESLEDDSPKNFLSREEYNLLSDTEKNIRALDYYKKRKKRNWEIGRDFEMYVGYTFEKDGFNVIYFGIEKKLNDLGRDLIVKNKDLTYIVQCKYWSKEKQIHEKHLAQLYGTYIMYKLDNPSDKKVIPLFITHTTLSEMAKKFSKKLGIIAVENEELGEYPLIKCNASKDKYGLETKIYHLPMDQQYDKIIINQNEGDCMAFTIEEAEKKDFRRAYKWHGK